MDSNSHTPSSVSSSATASINSLARMYYLTDVSHFQGGDGKKKRQRQLQPQLHPLHMARPMMYATFDSHGASLTPQSGSDLELSSDGSETPPPDELPADEWLEESPEVDADAVKPGIVRI